MAEDEETVVGLSPPPRKTDVLFGSGEDWQAEACVNYGISEVAYQSGFRRAAFHLAEHVCETGRGQDFLVYPIVYLYRHHIELALKSIIGLASSLLEQELTGKDLKALGGHNLADLWRVARPRLDPVCELAGNAALPPADLEGIDAYITQLHEHDPDGQRFRYAKVKSKQPGVSSRSSLPPELTNINIRDLAIALEKLADYLDAVETWFDHLADQQAEMRSEQAGGAW